MRFAGAFGGGAGGADDGEPPLVPTVHHIPPVTERSARVWLKLQKRVAMNFPNETPLEDVIRYVKEATVEKEDKGIPIYVDPVGLQEAQKTMTTPVQIDLEGVPLAVSLKLVLEQLGLSYNVREDGLLVITSGNEDEGPFDPQKKLHDDLNMLRSEVKGLKSLLAHMRRQRRPAFPRGQQARVADPAAEEDAVRGNGGSRRRGPGIPREARGNRPPRPPPLGQGGADLAETAQGGERPLPR